MTCIVYHLVFLDVIVDDLVHSCGLSLAEDPGKTRFYLNRINTPCHSLESLQPMTQLASPGSESIRLTASVVFPGTNSIQPMTDAKNIRFWIDSWFDPEYSQCIHFRSGFTSFVLKSPMQKYVHAFCLLYCTYVFIVLRDQVYRLHIAKLCSIYSDHELSSVPGKWLKSTHISNAFTNNWCDLIYESLSLLKYWFESDIDSSLESTHESTLSRPKSGGQGAVGVEDLQRSLYCVAW